MSRLSLPPVVRFTTEAESAVMFSQEFISKKSSSFKIETTEIKPHALQGDAYKKNTKFKSFAKSFVY